MARPVGGGRCRISGARQGRAEERGGPGRVGDAQPTPVY